MFSESELILLHHYSNGIDGAKTLAEKMEKTRSQIYNIIKELKRKGILTNSEGIEISSDAFAIRLMRVMHNSKERATLLSDSGLDILIELREPRTVEELETILGISKPSIYRKIRIGRIASAIVKEGKRYHVNTKTWNGLYELLNSAADRKEVFDERVPRNSEILGRVGNEVIFSCPNGSEYPFTGFSAFGEFDFDAISNKNYYTTSKKPMDIQTAFEDAYTITKSLNDYRLRLLLMLFYNLNMDRIDPPIEFKNLYDRIQNGEEILRWPTQKDIAERMEIYSRSRMCGSHGSATD